MTQKNGSPRMDDPDTDNAEQADEDSQAQTVARDATLAATDLSEESERGGHEDPASLIPDDVPDLVEHMRDQVGPAASTWPRSRTRRLWTTRTAPSPNDAPELIDTAILPAAVAQHRGGGQGLPSHSEELGMKNWIVVAAAAAAVLTLAACNTVKGVGRDIESVGSAGERAVK